MMGYGSYIHIIIIGKKYEFNKLKRGGSLTKEIKATFYKF